RRKRLPSTRTRPARPYSRTRGTAPPSGSGWRRWSFDHFLDDELRQIVTVLRPFETVPPAIDELLDREQQDQHPGGGNDRGVDGQREQRRHPVAAEVEDCILPAEPDQQH